MAALAAYELRRRGMGLADLGIDRPPRLSDLLHGLMVWVLIAVGSIPFVVFVVQAVALKQTRPFQITA